MSIPSVLARTSWTQSMRLRACRAFLALSGREWLDAADASGRRRLDQPNDYLRLEIAAALTRPDVLVVPVLVEGAAMPGPETLPDLLRPLSRRQAVSLRDETWDADVDRLVAALGGTSRSRLPKGAKWALLAAAALAMIFVGRSFMTTDRRVLIDQDQHPRDGAPAIQERSDEAGSTARAPATAIAIPRAAEVVGGKLAPRC